MPEDKSFVRFHSGQYQFKFPFAIYADFEAILQEETKIYGSFISEDPYTKRINCHVPSSFCTYNSCAYGEVKDPLKLYRGKDCIEVFCKHIKSEAKRLFNMFPERPMKRLTQEECRGFNRATKCHICFNDHEKDDEFNYKVRDYHYTGFVSRTCP